MQHTEGATSRATPVSTCARARRVNCQYSLDARRRNTPSVTLLFGDENKLPHTFAPTKTSDPPPHPLKQRRAEGRAEGRAESNTEGKAKDRAGQVGRAKGGGRVQGAGGRGAGQGRAWRGGWLRCLRNFAKSASHISKSHTRQEDCLSKHLNISNEHTNG